MDNGYDIFISYRRLDENGNISGRDQARLIAKELSLKGYRVFFDYNEINDDDFKEVIIPAVRNSKAFILVLTKDALKRCKNEDDWIRKEIETALSSGTRIISVSPDNSFNGWPLDLPASLEKIKTIQISEIHFGQLFEESITKLINDRILRAIPESKIVLTENYLSNLKDLTVSLYISTVKYREELKITNLVDNKYFFEMQDLVQKIFYISEICKHQNKETYESAKLIVDQYNEWIQSLKMQFNSDRNSQEYSFYATKSSELFSLFVDIVSSRIDLSKLNLS